MICGGSPIDPKITKKKNGIATEPTILGLSRQWGISSKSSSFA